MAFSLSSSHAASRGYVRRPNTADMPFIHPHLPRFYVRRHRFHPTVSPLTTPVTFKFSVSPRPLPPSAQAIQAESSPPPPSLPLNPSLSFLRLALPESRPLILALSATLLASTITLLTPFVFGRVLDVVTSFHRISYADGVSRLNRGATRLLILYCLGALSRFAEVALVRRAGERIVAQLRARLFSAMVRADVAALDRTSTGDMLSRLSVDTAALQKVFTKDIIQLLQGVFEAIVACCLLFALCRVLSFLVYVTIPVSVGAGIWYGGRTAKMAKAVSEASAQASQVAGEQLGGVRIVKSFGREALAETRYENEVKKVLWLGKRAALADGVLQMWNRGVFSLLTFGIFYVGGLLVATGQLSVGTIISFSLYTGHLTTAAGKLSSGIGEVIRASGSVDRIMKILETKPSIERTKYSERKPRHGSAVESGGSLEFRRVCFKYPGSDRTVLKNIEFKVEPRGSIAFVGASGGGKTTAVALMSRFYDPTDGEILLDGRPLREYDVREVREQFVGIVSQETYLMSGTIAENIGFGKEGATRAQIEEAAKAAGVAQFAKRLKNGLDTVVQKLSGGEQQRIMIARCLVKRPRIVVLDEFSSALDRASEALVNETVERLIRDGQNTVIVISHRLTTVRYCDQVLVFDNGEVVEKGRPADLLKKEGAYRRLLNKVKEV